MDRYLTGRGSDSAGLVAGVALILAMGVELAAGRAPPVAFEGGVANVTIPPLIVVVEGLLGGGNIS
jgi:hypothetical protein